MIGIVEVIALLMGMSGFGLQQNPKAPTPDQSLQYAMPDADVVAHIDVAAVVPGNFKVLQQLGDQPQIKASPELAKMVRKMVGEVEGVRGIAKMSTGIDITSDIYDATAFLQVVPKSDPKMVVAVHGKFTPAVIEKVSGLTKKPIVKVGNAAWVDTGDGNAVGLTKDGVLLAGTTNLIKDRVADTWKAPARNAGSSLTYAADMLAQKPVFGFVMALSQTARSEALSKHKDQNFMTDLVKRHKMASFAIYADGIGWSWVDSTKAGLDAMGQFSDGFVDILRAAQIAPRGFAKIVLSGIDSYKGTDKQLDEVIKHKADIMKLVSTYTGDGSFKSQIDADPKTLRLNVRLTGKTLSEVLPFGGIVPLATLGFLMATKDPGGMSPTMQIPAPAAPAPAPTKRP